MLAGKYINTHRYMCGEREGETTRGAEAEAVWSAAVWSRVEPPNPEGDVVRFIIRKW